MNLDLPGVRDHARLRIRLLAVLAFAVVIAATLLLLGMVRYERAFNASLAAEGRVHQIFVRAEAPGAAPIVMPGSSADLAQALLAVRGGLKIARMAFPYDPQAIIVGNRTHFERVASADPRIGEVLALPTSNGDLRAALAQPDGAAVTFEGGRRLFGSASPLGEKFEVNGAAYTVRAILADVHDNGQLSQMDVLVSGLNPSSALGELEASGPGTLRILGAVDTYVRLDRADEAAAVIELADRAAARSDAQFARQNPAAAALKQSHRLVDLQDAGARARAGAAPDPERADPLLLAGVMIMAGLVVAGAVLNFTNLAVTFSVADSRVAALRKIYGASGRSLWIAEAGVTCLWVLVALVIGYGLALLLRGPFVGLVDRPVDLSLTLPVLACLVGVALGVGLLAALYPAFVLSRVPPAAALRARGISAPGAGLLRRGLVIVQVSASVGMLGAGIIMWQQLSFATDQALGFDPADLVAYRVSELIASDDPHTATVSAGLASAGASAVAYADALPTEGASMSSRLGRPGQVGQQVQRVGVSGKFLSVMGARWLAGRPLTPADEASGPSPATLPRPLILTEATSARLGFETPGAAIGQGLNGDNASRFTVVGVVADLPVGGLRQPSPPLVVFSAGVERGRYIVIPQGGVDVVQLDGIVRGLFPDTPFDRFFVADRVAQAYLDVRRLLGLVALFSVLSALTAFGGMATVSALEAQKLTSEASVRKVFGAAGIDIAIFFARKLAVLAGIGGAVGVLILLPAGYSWLQGFTERFGSPLPAALIACLSILALVAFAAAFHVMRLARIPPAVALRQE